MVKKEQIDLIKQKANRLRHHIIDMIGYKDGKVGHLGGSCSAADIVATLYFYKMNISAAKLGAPDRDRFLLSKGHAALVQYAALAELGAIAEEELARVKNYGAMLQGHPDKTKTAGIEANTGSLGQGLSIGLGIAMGLNLDNIKARVYVLMGDGELAEGQIWEAATAAAAYKRDNLVAILDKNGIQAMGSLKERMDQGDFAAKWKAFGWHVIEINGHDIEEICNALDAADAVKNQPVVIVANTVKGKGVAFAENKAAFHNGGLTEEQFNQAHKDVDAMAIL